jgi:hypothetical protein
VAVGVTRFEMKVFGLVQEVGVYHDHLVLAVGFALCLLISREISEGSSAHRVNVPKILILVRCVGESANTSCCDTFALVLTQISSLPKTAVESFPPGLMSHFQATPETKTVGFTSWPLYSTVILRDEVPLITMNITPGGKAERTISRSIWQLCSSKFTAKTCTVV